MCTPGYDLSAEAILLCESDGTPGRGGRGNRPHERRAARRGRHRPGREPGRGRTHALLERAQERLPASGRISPDYMCMDSTIPRKRLADILLAIRRWKRNTSLRCCNVFHAGDGNLHPLILFDANDADQLHRAEQFGADIMKTSVPLAAPSPASTAWALKSSPACACSSPTQSWSRWNASSSPFDPQGLLNPGKVIPTPNRCGTWA